MRYYRILFKRSVQAQVKGFGVGVGHCPVDARRYRNPELESY